MMSTLNLFQTQPLFGIVLTVAAYAAASTAWRRFGGSALLHPVLVGTALVSVTLLLTGMHYETYFSQTAVLNETLGLVIVALAVPLYRQFGLIRESGSPLVIALIVGSLIAFVTTLALPVLAHSTTGILATLAPKSTTAAVAVEIAERAGGVASLTAVVVIATGIFGAVFGPGILKAVGVKDERAMGFALGVASHAIGTARSFQISDVAGAFASLGMILNALLTIALAPVILGLLAR
jgi:predicted murein hydrolase (TIGR00659 family)